MSAESTSPGTPSEAPATLATQIYRQRLSRLLLVAVVCGLVGLGLTVLPMAGITPLRLALSFAVGQPLCGLALILFVVTVLLDLRKRRIL